MVTHRAAGAGRRTRNAFLLLPALLLLFPATLAAEGYGFLGDYVSHETTDSSVLVRAVNNCLRITIMGDGIVRVQVGRDGRIRDIPSWVAPASVVTGTASRRAPWSLEVRDSALRITLDAGAVELRKYPLRLRFYGSDGALLNADDDASGHGWDGNEVQVWKSLGEDERFFGLGEKTGDLDKRGRSWVMWNSDIPGYSNEQDPLYASIPFFIGVRKAGAYGIFFDNSYRSFFHLGSGSKRVFSFGAEDGEMHYSFIFGPAMRDVISRYTAIAGRMPLPPLWALGYQQCRWNYYPEFELRDVARNFRQRRIPADALYLDIRYMDAYKVFTWNRAAFPDPRALARDLRERGFRLVTIIDPGIKVEPGYRVYDEGVANGYFARYPDGVPYEGEVWPGWCHFPDFTRADACAWWGRCFGGMMDEGVAGFWNDMNEPAVWGREIPSMVRFDDGGRGSTIRKIHNAYAFLEARASYDGMRRHRPDERPFILTRAGYAGIQRYAALWTGDNVARWDNLQMALRMCMGLGLSGMPFVGADVGGFIDSPTPELFARWVQAGAFTPLFRTHTAINTRDQEPWSFGEETEDNVRRYISLRYRLLPYIYSAFRDASATGIPVMRPVFLDYPGDAASYDPALQLEYLFGDNILVAPVVHEAQVFKKVHFPPGLWVDAHGGASFQGPGNTIVDAPWWRLPLFYRAGGFIPRRNTVQYTGERPLEHLIVDVITGADGGYTLYLDEGNGYGYERGAFDEIVFAQRTDGSGVAIDVSSSAREQARDIRTITFVLHNVATAPSTLRAGGEGLGVYQGDDPSTIISLELNRVEAGPGSAVSSTDAAGDEGAFPEPGTWCYDAQRHRCAVTVAFRAGAAFWLRAER